MLTGIEIRLAAERRDGCSAPIHVGLGFEDRDRHTLPGALHLTSTVPPAEWAQLPTIHEPIGEAEPGVVPGVLVLRAGVPQPHDRVQGLGFRFGLALDLILGLRLPDELRLGRGRYR